MRAKDRTLRGRSIRSVYWFGAIMVLAYAAVVLILLAKLEDRLMLSRLDRLADQAILDLEGQMAENSPATPSGERLSVYIGVEALPVELRPLFEELPVGDHEIHEHLFFLDDVEHFVAVRQLPGLDRRVFVYWASEASEGVTLWWTPVLGSFLLGLGLIGLLAPWLGSRLADGVVEPLTRLTGIVEASTPEELGPRVRSAGLTGEVGVLADALAESAERCTEFATRESRFTRNASHELRSPVTVIRGATDLLGEQFRDDRKAAERLGRIQRSLDHMEETIEAFLWLAREPGSSNDSPCDLQAVVERVADQQRALQPARARDLVVVSNGPVEVAAPESILRIVSSNLISNALRHSVSGPVTVELADGRLSVEDHGPGLAEADLRELTKPFVTTGGGGHGLGLAIVDEICQRFGWRLQLANTAAGGALTTLEFPTSAHGS